MTFQTLPVPVDELFLLFNQANTETEFFIIINTSFRFPW